VRLSKAILLIILVLFLSEAANAVVNFQNGNYNLEFIDFKFQQSNSHFRLKRFYNSLDSTGNWFGKGWSSNLASRIEFLGNGDIAYFENGIGPIKILSNQSSQKNPKEIFNLLMNKIKENENHNPASLKLLEEKLQGDKILLATYLSKYNLRNSEENEGTWQSSIYSNLTIVKKGDIYNLEDFQFANYKFNSKGQLIEIAFSDQESYSIAYLPNNLIEKIKGMKNLITFEWNSERLLTAIKTGNLISKYEYKDSILVHSNDQDKNEYMYSYNSNNQLEALSYSDGKKLEIGYHPTSHVVKKVNDRNITSHSYEFYQSSSPYQINGVKIKNELNGLVTIAEFEYRLDENKQKFLFRNLLKEGTSHIENFYSSCCSKPIKTIKDGLVTEMTYDQLGNLISLIDNQGHFLKIAINTQWNKPSRISDEKSWKEFSFNNIGLISKITKSEGEVLGITYNHKNLVETVKLEKSKDKVKNIKISYDGVDRFDTVTFGTGEVLKYSYSNNGKVEIKLNKSQDVSAKVSLVSLLNNLLNTIENPIPLNIL
jgi:YD repeat-containing protein